MQWEPPSLALCRDKHQAQEVLQMIPPVLEIHKRGMCFEDLLRLVAHRTFPPPSFAIFVSAHPNLT